MTNKNNIDQSQRKFNDFIEFRKDLKPIDKKIEAAYLINQTASVEVDKAYQSVSARIQQKQKISNFFNTLTRIAAIFTMPLLAFAIWSLFFVEISPNPDALVNSKITTQEIHSPEGMRSHVVLPDGTNLWLNAGSILRYGIPFTRESRVVELIGEAFLDVVKNEHSPFIVKAGNTELEVLGTQFNVNSYSVNEIKVALKEGEVKFKFKTDEGNVKFVELKSNDFLQFYEDEKEVHLENTNIEKYISWHQNVMILDDTPIVDLANMLKQWYGIDVIIADEEIKRYKFTTTFDNEPLHRVLELLEISSPEISINYSIGKPIKGSKKFSPSVVTITKK